MIWTFRSRLIKTVFLASLGLSFISINTIFAQVAGIPGNHTEQEVKKNSASGRKALRKDLIKIKSTDVPVPIKIILDKDKYKGWEKGRIYRSKSTNVYRFEVTQRGKRNIFRFRADGSVVHDDDV